MSARATVNNTKALAGSCFHQPYNVQSITRAPPPIRWLHNLVPAQSRFGRLVSASVYRDVEGLLTEERGLLRSSDETLQVSMVQWYPGHIARAERQLKEQLEKVDILLQVSGLHEMGLLHLNATRENICCSFVSSCPAVRTCRTGAGRANPYVNPASRSAELDRKQAAGYSCEPLGYGEPLGYEGLAELPRQAQRPGHLDVREKRSGLPKGREGGP